MSAAESRLVRSAGLPNQPIEPSAWTPIVCGWLASGPACSARRRRRRIERSPRISLPLAYVEGRVRERQRSPSSLSKSSCWADMPTKPGVERLVEHRLHRAPARGASGWTSLRVARSRPIVAVRMSEWPMNAARFGPSGSDSSAPTYSSAVRPGLVLVDRADDVLARDRLDPAEQVAGVDAADVHGRERAGAEQQRGHAVPHRLRQARAVEHLDVVVRVDVDEARDHPLARRRRPPRGSRSRRGRRW